MIERRQIQIEDAKPHQNLTVLNEDKNIRMMRAI